MSAVPRKLTIGLLAAVMLFCIYRAKTQGLTVDEAWVFKLFVNKPLDTMAKEYDACNHVLHTLLTKLFRGQWGTSELSLRISSLIGALVYLTAIERLTHRLIGGFLGFLTAGALALNPLVLDFLVASRGYGLGLGLWMWALASAMSWAVEGLRTGALVRAGILSGLAIAANLTLIVPTVALGFVLMLMALRRGVRNALSTVENYLVPATVIGFLVLVVPLQKAEASHFYMGEKTLRRSVISLVGSGIKVHHRWPGPDPDVTVSFIADFLIPLFAILLAIGLALAAGKIIRTPQWPWRLAPFSLVAGTFLASALLLIAVHLIKGVPYPLGRSGLYLIPVFTLALILACKAAVDAGWRRLQVPAVLLAAVLTLHYAGQIEPRYFINWAFDASTPRLLRVMQEDVSRNLPGRQVKIGIHWMFEHTVDYYRFRRAMTWMEQPVKERLDSVPLDYYLLFGRDSSLVDKLHLKVLEQDPLSGAVLARRQL